MSLVSQLLMHKRERERERERQRETERETERERERLGFGSRSGLVCVFYVFGADLIVAKFNNVDQNIQTLIELSC